MSQVTPRLRMFAGPNGSGKSTLKHLLPLEQLGVYINADEIELRLRTDRKLRLADYHVAASEDDVNRFFQDSPILAQQNLTTFGNHLSMTEGCLVIDQLPLMSYYSAAIADFLRSLLFRAGVSFSFETVMSHPEKISLLKSAQDTGYRTYLYYIATDDPVINVSRVRLRVSQGGHNVPEEKILSRYYRSIDLLIDAIRVTNRAYIFDNSNDGLESTWLAEITDGQDLELKSTTMPAWFRKAVWDKVQLESSHS